LPLVRPLPHWSEPDLAPVESAALERLDALTGRLVEGEPAQRLAARQELLAVDVTWLPALARRFDRLADGANKPALEALLERAREHSRERLKAAARAAGQSGPVATPDYLELLLLHPDRSSPDLRALTEIIAYSRMFEKIATLPAARRVLDVYVRFGEFLRVDTQLSLARMQDAAVAPLIEATAHPVPRIAHWAQRQLQDLGKAQPSEALLVTDLNYRADILRAYGKIRNTSTARLLLSYAAHERAVLRQAAREAVTLLGPAGLWPLRDAYETTMGERAPNAWPWERLAREFFAGLDQQRQGKLYSSFNRGLKASQRGDLTSAGAAFDEVLAYEPAFERGALMAPVYLAIAEGQAESDADAAQLALRRAERLDPLGPTQARAQSLRHTLEARRLLERGIVDEALVRRARELDPANPRAQALLTQLLLDPTPSQLRTNRYLGAAVIAALGVLGLLIMGLRQRRAQRANATTAEG
jgi:hypothetical protein